MNAATILAKSYALASRPIGGRGFTRFMKLVSRAVPSSSAKEHIELLNEGLFSFPAGDPYWNYTFRVAGSYEPELHHLLKRVPPDDRNLFLDCGANYGYWSVVASKTIRTVAIEASGETSKTLRRNCSLNGDRFITLQAAVSDGAKETLTFENFGLHCDRKIADANSPMPTETVKAVTIDSLVKEYSKGGLTIIKLDVEFAEIAAIAGGRQSMAANTILFYEDHGIDPSSAVTAHLLALGKRIYFIGADGEAHNIYSAEHATSFKRSVYEGYNFVALGDLASERLIT
jgi:FkbM family methyltransferase